MGSYVLYLLMQAFVTLIFAYFSGTLVFKERKLYMLLFSLGFYMMMCSALVEVWGDRAGWTATGVGLNAALVATGVAVIGTGAVMREAGDMEHGDQMDIMAKVFLGVAVVMGILLAVSGGYSSSIVDEESLMGAEISGAFSHLGPAGWALGIPLFIGGVLLAWMGARRGLAHRDIRGFWLMGAGVLYLLWPFDIWLNELPLAPAILLMAMTMTYFGFQPPKEDEEKAKEEKAEEGPDEPVEDGSRDDDGPAPWVKEAIAAQKTGQPSDADGTDEDRGEEPNESEDKEPPMEDDAPST
ncbi:MAG: hypothetical protein JSW25_02750 [Thermoplasmata archaeon]|nr:MAG: hypothetical protein JSW25_02750 [Thermoplasmata archaeon]